LSSISRLSLYSRKYQFLFQAIYPRCSSTPISPSAYKDTLLTLVVLYLTSLATHLPALLAELVPVKDVADEVTVSDPELDVSALGSESDPCDATVLEISAGLGVLKLLRTSLLDGMAPVLATGLAKWTTFACG